MKKTENTFIYLICEDINNFELYLKIGISNNVIQRMTQLDTGPIKRYKILSTYEFKNRKIALDNEQYLHKLLKNFNTKGEWFLVNKYQLKTIDEVLVEFLQGYVDYNWSEDENIYYRNDYFNYKNSTKEKVDNAMKTFKNLTLNQIEQFEKHIEKMKNTKQFEKIKNMSDEEIEIYYNYYATT